VSLESVNVVVSAFGLTAVRRGFRCNNMAPIDNVNVLCQY
jgi:hypothetical protein